MELILILISLLFKLKDCIEIDPYTLSKAVSLYRINNNLRIKLRPLRLSIPSFLYTLANIQICNNEHNSYHFPITIDKKIISQALTEIDYLDNNYIREDIDITVNKIYEVFKEEIDRKIDRISYTEFSNKYKVDGYYEAIYSNYINEISDNIELSLSTIIYYSILKGDGYNCYNNCSWRSNIYKVLTYKNTLKILDCFSSPIYPTIKPYCSLLPTDKFFDGCIGSYSYDVLVKENPDILLINPTNDVYTKKYAMNVLDRYLENKDNSIGIITTQYLSGDVKNYIDTTSVNDNKLSYIIDHCMKSKKLLGFLIIPTNIVIHSLIYNQNTRMIKSDIEIESSYIMLFYGNLPLSIPNVTVLKKMILDRIKQNSEKGIIFDKYEFPERNDIYQYRQKYNWTTPLNIHREFMENIRLLKIYFS